MVKVLVIGGAGYVGSHACKALARAGYQPVVYDNLSRGHRRMVRWGPLEEGDIGDAERLDAVFARHRPEAVLHFAAFAYVGESMAEPLAYYRNNLVGSLTVVEAMARHGVPHLVFSSTCATYGLPRRLPMTEAHPQAPINPYGYSKLAVERLLADIGAARGLGWVALRYFNAAGADADGEVGECHAPETHAVPLAIQAALGGAPFAILGTDYPTPDGTAVRDYIHVADLAAGHVAALEHLRRGGESAAVNLGTGTGTSVRQLLDAVAAAAGRPVPAVTAPRRAGDPPELVADTGKAQELLGWTARHGLNEIVASAWKWHAPSCP